MSPHTAGDAVRRIKGVLPRAAFAVESIHGFRHEPQYNPRWDVKEPLTIGPIEDLIVDDIAKLLIRDDDDHWRRHAEGGGSRARRRCEVTHSDVNDSLLEVSAPGVTKGTTLAHLAAEWGIDQRDVVAFGDMPNDVDMLRWAGWGYAVGNAHPSVLAVADEHAPSIADDGVAQVLERLLALP